MIRHDTSALNARELSASYLAQFVGTFANQRVLSDMKRAGYGDLRESHGYLVQHLLRGPHSVGQLAKLLGISQQAVSKSVAELTAAGYLELVPVEDARVRYVRLSRRGHSAVLVARRSRARLEARLARRLGRRKFAQLRAALFELLVELGGVAPVEGRRVPGPVSGI
jgi:DNA-binding MarR family transcriptional regulator